MKAASRKIRNVSNNYGFVRHQKSPFMNDDTTNAHIIQLLIVNNSPILLASTVQTFQM